MTAIYDAGFELFKREPELMLAQVWWRAGNLSDPALFVAGYQAARQQRDEYMADRGPTG